jgi:hypothetical protein
MKKFFQKLLGSRKEDAFITLIQVALEDQEIKKQLIAILTQPHSERLHRLKRWRSELGTEGAPESLIDALDYLQDEARANQALVILQDQ